MENITQSIAEFMQTGVLPIALMILRLIIAVMALYVVWRSYTSFKKGLRRREPVVMLANHASKIKFAVLHWENSIGRSKSCDIVLPDTTVSRDHAVLMRREEGWIISDTDSAGGVFVNGKKIDGQRVVGIGDEMRFGRTKLVLAKADSTPEKKRIFRGFSKKAASPFRLMFMATIVILLMAVQLFMGTGEIRFDAFIPFGIVFALGWGLFAFSTLILKRVSFEIETVAYMLSGIGAMTLAGHDMDGVYTQLAAMLIGILIFCVLTWFMANIERVEKYQIYIAGAAIALFLFNVVFGTVSGGAKNWVHIGPLSLQPSELIKIAFIAFGAGSLYRLQTKKNMAMFLVFAGVCLAFLFYMRDFGTALIFFAAFLIIAFMRSGSVRTIALVIAAAVAGVMIILYFRPYVMERFLNWGHIWEDINDTGYQQTRMLTYMASGGLLGVGVGNTGFVGIPAFDSDLVFGLICEENGLLLGLVILFAIALFILYARADVTRSRSTFYSIASCAAAGLLLFQTCLNVFGSADIIPLTGVTLPFISSGGSSVMSCWGLMAFLKASDERTYAAKRMSRKEEKMHMNEEKLRYEREMAMRERERERQRQGRRKAATY